MICNKPGHNYKLQQLDGQGFESIRFVDRNHNTDTPGTNNQEVLRALIDRVKYLDSETPWDGNKKILTHLRLALVLHESRHLERITERGELEPEHVQTGENGHFTLTGRHTP